MLPKAQIDIRDVVRYKTKGGEAGGCLTNSHASPDSVTAKFCRFAVRASIAFPRKRQRALRPQLGTQTRPGATLQTLFFEQFCAC